jgi:type VII secretion protein EccE
VTLPGPGRITVALLVIVPAAMAYPWHSANEQWTLGVAVVVAALLLSRWRGAYVTELLGRRWRLLTGGQQRAAEAGDRTTVVLRVLQEPDGGPDLPLPLIADYLDRYGIRCDAVRVTSRDTPIGRSTWIGLTISAAANLAALQARSADIPLRETAEVAVRRLADQLREQGWAINTTDVDVPDLLGSQPTERWRSVQDGTHGYVASYGIAASAGLAGTLTELWSAPSSEVWTALQFTRHGDDVQVSAACAVRSDEPVPTGKPPLAGLVAQPGRQRAALTALHPLSTDVIAAHPVSHKAVGELSWPANRVPVRT